MSHDTPSLALRYLLQKTAADSGLKRSTSEFPASITGLTPTAQAFAASVLASETPVILVVPADRDIDRLVADGRFFLSALSGVTEAEAKRRVLPFPSYEVDPYREIEPHFEITSARGLTLAALAQRRASLVIASAAAILPRLSPPNGMLDAVIELRTSVDLSPIELVDRLMQIGFSRTDPVDSHGQFCLRGGIVDIFPAGDTEPVRIEFAGDTIESLRRFDPSTQRSIATLDCLSIQPLSDQLEMVQGDVASVNRQANFRDYIQYLGAEVIVSEPLETAEQLFLVAGQLQSSYADRLERGETALEPDVLQVSAGEVTKWLDQASSFESLEIGSDLTNTESSMRVLHVPCQPVPDYHGRLQEWVKEIRRGQQRGDTMVFVAETGGRAERIIELLAEDGLVALRLEQGEEVYPATLLVTTGILTKGFRLPEASFQVYSEGDLFEHEHLVRRKKRSAAKSFLSDFRDLKIGDRVVHVEHGIGAFVGLRQLAVNRNQVAHEFMELRYASEDKLFVPVEQLDLLQKYTGASNPKLDRLGGTTWEKAKTRVKKSMRDMASELLKLYAARHALPGYAFSADTHWQQEFEGAFDHTLTTDQQTAISEIKLDMEKATAMDRLLCGDVGYGKTEIALRAAFKAVMDGKQVALLTATTVLAFQHYKTLCERFAAFPVRIEMLSRFRTKPEQKLLLVELAAGKIEVIIGTHRLLSKDVSFRDLGLLIVDEEQRFGVAHKERIKQMRHRVDVLTLTATPIPRTLNMSLAGIRDMSVIETPPRDRLAIQTNVIKFDPQVIGQAIRTELSRGGQVYVVHNRVESIHSVASLVARMVPEARLAVAHGQTTEAALEKVMIEFVAHEYDVLVATTIIENGLDIPNVNTIIINHAEKYGLAQLYQLRGRVGRSDRRAYAYLVVPADNALTPVARQRLSAIREFSELGSGFRVAALDLEIRGAGNLLGGQQSGHIEAIGFDMYVKLLQQAVEELQGNEVKDFRRSRVNLGIELRIDETYVVETNQRLVIYRKIAEAENEETLVEVMAEVRDRYGSMHSSVERLADYARVRILAEQIGIEAIDREGSLLVVRFRADAGLDPLRLVEFVAATQSATLSPEGVVRINLDGAGGSKNAPRIKGNSGDKTQVSTSSQIDLLATKPVESGTNPLINQGFTSDQEYLTMVQRVLRQLSGSG